MAFNDYFLSVLIPEVSIYKKVIIVNNLQTQNIPQQGVNLIFFEIVRN